MSLMNLSFLIYKMGTVIPITVPSFHLLHRIGFPGLAKACLPQRALLEAHL